MNNAKQTILVPVELEESSSEVVKTAVSMAPRLGVEVVLLHVYMLPRYDYMGVSLALPADSMNELVARISEAAVDFARSHGGLPILVREGEPAQEILKAIEELQPTMVVMGTHGRRGLSRLLLGSVAETVIRGSQVPVLTVPVRGGPSLSLAAQAERRDSAEHVVALDIACP